jgi:hypothetical protein
VTPTYQPRRLGADEDHRWRAPISPPNCRRAAPLAFSLNRDSDELTLHAALLPAGEVSDHPWPHQLPADHCVRRSLAEGPGRSTVPTTGSMPALPKRYWTAARRTRYSAPGTAPTSVPVPARRWPRLSPTRCLADRVGSRLGGDDKARTRHHLTVTSRHEWMFWDAAWRLEEWPLGCTKPSSTAHQGPGISSVQLRRR